MPALDWQKSSSSCGSDGNDCLELASTLTILAFAHLLTGIREAPLPPLPAVV